MMALLLTVLFSGIVAGLSKVMEVTQPAFIVAKSQGPVNFPCELKNAGDAKKLKITLLKQRGNESISICASSLPTENGNPFNTKEDGIQCQIHPGRKSVNVTLWGLKSTDAGLYICQTEWIYPPPYYSVMSSGTQLFVVDTEPCPVVFPYLWIFVTVVLGLLGYSTLITICIVTKVLQKSRYFTPGIYEKIIPV